MNRGGPAFLVVGTPRSGTTLVQRLLCELSGVRMPPETHFFSLYAPSLLRRRRFPLQGAALGEEIRAWAGNPGLGGMSVDADRIVDRLNRRVDNLWDMFAAIVGELAGDGEVHGEKTPTHLLWWRPLARSLPLLKFIMVTRDPRAVVVSAEHVPFGMRGHVLHAERWSADQRLVREAQKELGPRRCLVLRYEDVVAEPDAARSGMASFLGIRDSREPRPSGAGAIYQPWEAWKERASGPVTTERAETWRAELDDEKRADVSAICRREMPRFGYRDGVPAAATAFMRLSRLPPGTQWRRLRFRVDRRIRLSWLDSDRVASALRSGVDRVSDTGER